MENQQDKIIKNKFMRFAKFLGTAAKKSLQYQHNTYILAFMPRA